MLSEYIVTLAIWIYYYGIQIEFVYKTIIWFGAHWVLTILVNIMFYMIRLVSLCSNAAERKEERLNCLFHILLP